MRSLTILTVLIILPLVSSADTLNPLTSDGSLGNFNSIVGFNQYLYFNTDTGGVETNTQPGYCCIYDFTPTVVSQAGGPSVNVYNFSSFNIPQGEQLVLFGTAPAAILSQSDMTIAGNVIIDSGGNQGGGGVYQSAGNNGAGPGGGGGGGFGIGYYSTICGTGYSTGGDGGGGGMASAGSAGAAGLQAPCDNRNGAGGAGGAAQNLSLLAGGGGGGSGGGCGPPYCTNGGAPGGSGGGAALFGTTGDFTITSTGSINADGANGGCCAGASGGGGAGGDLWFETGGVWTNDGTVSAQGGNGGAFPTGSGNYYTFGGNGSGGYVMIDPTQIVNNGIIDVAGGGSSNTGGVTLDGTLSGTGAIEGSAAPEPSVFWLAAVPLAWLIAQRRFSKA